jgi:hypothetical protein
MLAPKKLQSQTVTRKNLRKTLKHKKVTHKMLMELTPGVNYTMFLLADFLPVDLF